MSVSFTDNWATDLNIFRLPAGVPIEITWFPGSPPEAWVTLWMNQLNSADDITTEVTITGNVTNSGTYLWTPPLEYASTNDTYDYQLGVAGYEDDPGLSQGSRLFYIVPAGSSSSSSSSAAPSATPSPSTSPTISSPTTTPTQSSASPTLSPETSPTQSTVPPVVIHKGLSTGAAAGIGVGVAIAVLVIPLAAFLWFWRKRKAESSEKGGFPSARNSELHGESRVVSELTAVENETPEMGGIPWKVSSPSGEEMGQVHELGGEGV